jgi:ubiquinone/menaquinone biosynthesis C-methylase UbiE
MPKSHDVARDRHGNPKDLKLYLSRLISPERDAWQLPDRVVRALALKRGQTVGEIGAGPGYFTLRLARAVGPTGAVLAVEVEPKLITILRDRLEQERVANVTPVFALGSDPFLPPRACDVILAVNVMHHVHGLPAYLRRLTRALAAGGRIAAVDFHRRELPIGPPLDHKLAREALLSAARRAGLRLTAEPTFLPHQYFLVLEVAPARGVGRSAARRSPAKAR